MHLHQAPREREPDAHAHARAIVGPLALHEQLEDARQDVGIDPRTIVAHANHRAAAGIPAIALHIEPDVAARGRELRRVAQ